MSQPCPRCRGLMREGDAYEDTRCLCCSYRPALPPLAYIGNRDISPEKQSKGYYATKSGQDMEAAGKRVAKLRRLKAKLLEMTARGVPVPQAARELGINPRTAYRWHHSTS